MQKQRTYIPVITSLRGLAATAICFYHFVLGTSNYIETEWIRNFFYYAQYGVPMFFVISGVVLPVSLLNNNYQISRLPKFILKRLVRLEPPYLISLIVAVLYLVFQGYHHSNIVAFSWSNFLLHLGYLIPFVEGETWINPIYWSLAVEFQYYLFLSVAFIALKNKNFVIRLSVYVFVFGISFISDEKALLWRWLPMFLVGIIYVLFQYKIILLKEYVLVSFCSLFLVNYILGIPNMVVVIFCIFVIHYYPSFNFKFSRRLGEISYSLYLIHFVVGQAIINFLSHTYRLPFQKFLVILTGYFVSLFVAWILYIVVESPSKKVSSSIRY
ncbi:MAG: acyltransferase [Saprospiraceae bacterium]|nr:acyltransferase [Saprospiraceae bacterium]